jgi:hypothetical protein
MSLVFKQKTNERSFFIFWGTMGSSYNLLQLYFSLEAVGNMLLRKVYRFSMDYMALQVVEQSV